MNTQLTSNAHICHIYRDRLEQKDYTRTFLRDALENKEAVVFIASLDDIDAWYSELQASGIDLVEALRLGRIQALDPLDWYEPEEFNSIKMARRVWETMAKPLADFTGLRLIADMHWTTSTLTPSQLCHWEATANVIFEGLAVQVVCQYDLNRHSLAEVHAALRTHPFVRLDGRTMRNPNDESGEILAREPFLNETNPSATEVTGMLEILSRQL